MRLLKLPPIILCSACTHPALTTPTSFTMKAIIAVPVTLLLVARAYTNKSLTPAGIVAAVVTAICHAVHPWNLPFALLVVFFLIGSRVTHVKEAEKARLTLSSKGTSGGEGPRTHVQVLANSAVASVLCLLHAYQLSQRPNVLAGDDVGTTCFNWRGDLLIIGIIANYAAVAADTFSSELGILSSEEPVLITTMRKVPRGTNGAVTMWGLMAGAAGSMAIMTTTVIFLPLCEGEMAGQAGGYEWSGNDKHNLLWFLAIWGTLGSVLDSFLGARFQSSVKDVRSGKIVEGDGGKRVLVANPKGRTGSGSGSAEHKLLRADIATTLLSGESGDAVEKPMGAAESAVDDSAVAPEQRYDPNNKHRRSSYGDDRPSRVVENGLDLLDNNDVNFLMAFIMSTGAMLAASRYWGVELGPIF